MIYEPCSAGGMVAPSNVPCREQPLLGASWIPVAERLAGRKLSNCAWSCTAVKSTVLGAVCIFACLNIKPACLQTPFNQTQECCAVRNPEKFLCRVADLGAPRVSISPCSCQLLGETRRALARPRGSVRALLAALILPSHSGDGRMRNERLLSTLSSDDGRSQSG